MHIRIKGHGITGRNTNILIDGGGSENYEVGKKSLMPYLLKNGVSRVDAAFVSHLHTDHYRGICELAREGMVKRLFVYESNRLKVREICKETGLDEKAVVFLHAGQSVALTPGPSGRTSLKLAITDPSTVPVMIFWMPSHHGWPSSR